MIVETVGVGQVELDVDRRSPTPRVVVVTPGWGDAIQANKAGLLEVADVFVVNKADRPGARDARRDLELMLDLGHISGLEARSGRRPAIVETTSTTGAGAQALLEAIDEHRAWLRDGGGLAERGRRRRRLEMAGRVERLLEARANALLDSASGRDLLDAVEGRLLSPGHAAEALVSQLLVGLSPTS